MGTLDAQVPEVSTADEQGLCGAEDREERKAPDIGLRLRAACLRERASARCRLDERRDHHAADPDGKRGVKRGHGGPVVVDGEDGVTVHLNRRRDKRGDCVGIRDEDGADFVQVVRCKGVLESVLKIPKTACGRIKRLRGAVEGGTGIA